MWWVLRPLPVSMRRLHRRKVLTLWCWAPPWVCCLRDMASNVAIGYWWPFHPREHLGSASPAAAMCRSRRRWWPSHLLQDKESWCGWLASWGRMQAPTRKDTNEKPRFILLLNIHEIKWINSRIVHCSWIIFKIFRFFKKTLVFALCFLHAFAARGEVQQKNVSRGSGGEPCDFGSSAECAGHLAYLATCWALLRLCCLAPTGSRVCLEVLLCSPVPKDDEEKGKKGKKGKGKGKEEKRPSTPIWLKDWFFFESVFNFLYDSVLKDLKDLCSRASFMSAWFGGCAAGCGQQLKWDRARFGSCGISRCWNFSPLALGQGTSKSHAVSVMSCDDWLLWWKTQWKTLKDPLENSVLTFSTFCFLCLCLPEFR